MLVNPKSCVSGFLNNISTLAINMLVGNLAFAVSQYECSIFQGLKENIEKTSATLGRNAVYVKTVSLLNYFLFAMRSLITDTNLFCIYIFYI